MVFDVAMKIIEFIKEEKTGLIVSCVIISVLGFFLHLIQTGSMDLEHFFTWLPVSWLMVGVLGFSFKFFLGDR